MGVIFHAQYENEKLNLFKTQVTKKKKEKLTETINEQFDRLISLTHTYIHFRYYRYQYLGIESVLCII